MAEQLTMIAKRGRGRPRGSKTRRNATIPPVPTYDQVEAQRAAGEFEPADPPPAEAEQAQPDAPAVMPNLTDDTIRELALDALRHQCDRDEAMKGVKSADASKNAVLKRAKKLGGDKLKQSIVEWLKERQMDPADLVALVTAKNRIWIVMQLPVGTQLGMFDEHTTIATHLENQKQESVKTALDAASDAYDRGYENGKLGYPLSRTGLTEESPHWTECLRGYSAGQRELMQEPGNPTASTQ